MYQNYLDDAAGGRPVGEDEHLRREHVHLRPLPLHLCAPPPAHLPHL